MEMQTYYDEAYDAMETVNEKYVFPKKGRGHHTSDGITRQGCVLGYATYQVYKDRPMVLGQKHGQEKFKMMFAPLQNIIEKFDPSFPYTTIQVNRNVKTKIHKDKSNYGWSYALSLGDFTGGEVLQYEEDKTTISKTIITHNDMKQQDGRKWHETAHYDGNRYAVIYFYSEQYALINRALGHNDPPFAKGKHIKSPIFPNHALLRKMRIIIEFKDIDNISFKALNKLTEPYYDIPYQAIDIWVESVEKKEEFISAFLRLPEYRQLKLTKMQEKCYYAVHVGDYNSFYPNETPILKLNNDSMRFGFENSNDGSMRATVKKIFMEESNIVFENSVFAIHTNTNEPKTSFKDGTLSVSKKITPMKLDFDNVTDIADDFERMSLAVNNTENDVDDGVLESKSEDADSVMLLPPIDYSLCKKNDHYYTTKKTWELIIPLIPPNVKYIWESAYGDGESGCILQELLPDKVIIHENADFFNWEPPQWDMCITNPPFSLKRRWLTRLKKLGKPFILLIPTRTRDAIWFNEMFDKHMVQAIPSQRLHFRVDGSDKVSKNTNIDTEFFCWKCDLPLKTIGLPLEESMLDIIKQHRSKMEVIDNGPLTNMIVSCYDSDNESYYSCDYSSTPSSKGHIVLKKQEEVENVLHFKAGWPIMPNLCRVLYKEQYYHAVYQRETNDMYLVVLYEYIIKVDKRFYIAPLDPNHIQERRVWLEKKHVREEKIIIKEEPKVIKEEPKVITEEPKVITEEPKVITEEPKVIIEKEKPQIVTDINDITTMWNSMVLEDRISSLHNETEDKKTKHSPVNEKIIDRWSSHEDLMEKSLSNVGNICYVYINGNKTKGIITKEKTVLETGTTHKYKVKYYSEDGSKKVDYFDEVELIEK